MFLTALAVCVKLSNRIATQVGKQIQIFDSNSLCDTLSGWKLAEVLLTKQ